MTCTFFGHRSVNEEIATDLREVLIDLIERHDVNDFYVGNNGSFDRITRRILKELSGKYPIRYAVVLAYIPKKNDKYFGEDYSDTLLPDGIETVPKRFAISYRNKWMLRLSDYVVTYVTHNVCSGAAQFKALAERQGKTVIELQAMISGHC